MPSSHRSVSRSFPAILFLIILWLVSPSLRVRSQGVPAPMQIVKLDTSAFPDNRVQEMKDAIQELTQDPLLLTGKDVFYIVAQESRGVTTLVTPDTQATQIPSLLGQYNPQTTYQYAYPLEGGNSLLEWFAR